MQRLMQGLKKNSVLIIFIAITIMVMAFTTSANALGETSRKDYKLMPGVWESTVYVTDSNNNNVRAHILRINKGSNVALKATSAKYYKAKSTKNSRKKATEKWGYVTVQNIMSGYNASKGTDGTAIAGVNGDFFNKDQGGMTLGKLIAEGKVLNDSTAEPFFAVMKDGSYALMEGTADTTDVQEAIAGHVWAVRDNKIVLQKDKDIEALNFIGITKAGDVIIACVDGREPTSRGITMYDMARLMKQQGCKNAINLDGGGSATMVTKRSNGKVAMRNTPADGLARTVSSALLVVKKSKSESTPKTDKPAVSMKESKTKLTKKNGYYYYKENGKKASGFRMINGMPYLFSSKGKGLNKVVTIGKTKYTFKKGKLTKTSDKKAGDVGIGFCGSSKDKQNLIYSYHFGNKKLSISPNPLVKKNSGKMENWVIKKDVPWIAMSRLIKTIDVGEGVKNIGSYFMFISRNPINEDSKKVTSALNKVSLPSTLKTIGEYSFYYNGKLKSVTIPKNVKEIKTKAFAYNTSVTYTFISKTPPKIGKNVFASSGKKSIIKVPSTKKWKSYLSKKKKNKIGFKGKVRYTK